MDLNNLSPTHLNARFHPLTVEYWSVDLQNRQMMENSSRKKMHMALNRKWLHHYVKLEIDSDLSWSVKCLH